jgi:hypothetical protein
VGGGVHRFEVFEAMVALNEADLRTGLTVCHAVYWAFAIRK